MEKVSTVKWAAELISDIIIELFFRQIKVLDFFKDYGLNEIKHTVSLNNFQKAMKDLLPKVSLKEVDKFAKDLETGHGGSISIDELQKAIDEGQDKTIKAFEKKINTTISGVCKTKNIPLFTVLKAHDYYGKDTIVVDDFLSELKKKFGANLTNLQYTFLTKKYESSPGRIDYVSFTKEIANASTDVNAIASKKKEEEYDKDVVEQIFNCLRDYMHKNDLKLVELLAEKDTEKKGVLNKTVLQEIFPKAILPDEALLNLSKFLGKNVFNLFRIPLLLDSLWTSADEEHNRIQAVTLVRRQNRKLKKYITANNIDLIGEFKRIDKENTGFLRANLIKSAFYNLGIKLTNPEMTLMLYYQNLPTDAKFQIDYKSLISKLEKQAEKTEEKKEKNNLKK